MSHPHLKALAIAAAFSLLSSASCLAQTKIVATKLDGVVERNHSGVYDQVFGELKFDYEVFSPELALDKFKGNEFDCIFPLDQDFYGDKSNTVQSTPINLAKIFIFTLKGPPITDLDKLKGMRVGMRSGLNYGPKLSYPRFKVEFANSIYSNVWKLRSDRIDAIVDFNPDMEDYLKKVSLSLVYDKNAPVIVHKDALLCHDGPKEREFVQRFNKAVKESDAKIKKLLGN